MCSMTEKPVARNHFFTPSYTTLTVHPKAALAYKTWLKFRPKTSPIHLASINKYHKPPTRIIFCDKQGYLYFDNFERMANILHHESDVSQPFIIITGNDEQITKMAWADVLRLCFYRGIDHVSLWQHLQKHCAQTTLKELMGCDSLFNEDYCNFAGINIDQYSYAQRSLKQEKQAFDLPQNMDWTNG